MKQITSRRMFLVIFDIVGLNLAFLIASFLHYEGSPPRELMVAYLSLGILLTIVKIATYHYFQLYNSIWEYASIEELMKVVFAVLVGNVIGILYFVAVRFPINAGVFVFAGILEMSFVGSLRFSYRVIRRLRMRRSITTLQYMKHSLIVGSGSTATLIATEIKNHPEVHGKLVGFIDDDPDKYKKSISGVKVLGNRFDIYSICMKYDVNEIILAIPTASKADMKEILSECKNTSAKVRILPGVREVIGGQVSMSKIRDVEIEDLLGREQVNLNIETISSYLEHQIVMVTGGGGSIGSELCRQIAKFNPRRIIILDIYENGAYDLQNELKRDYEDLETDVIIASVRDRDCIFGLIKDNRPDVIFHAAAHKHVPLMERMPKEAVKNNTFGTLNVAQAADRYGVNRFVLISTDKAVNPTNIMGASKRLCEMVIQGLATTSINTKFNAVRFGNVLGSNGSVIPLFKSQIENGGPVTVTHKEIIRYFMTIPEAAQLVIQTGAIAEVGEVFVLDMGEPVKIYDLAVDLIRLSGLKPFKDIDVEVVGLRPGEKLFEELLMNDEGLQKTEYKKIHVGHPTAMAFNELETKLLEMKEKMDGYDDEEFISLMKTLVPTYKDNKEVNKGNQHKLESIQKYRMAEQS